jgi:hypothetical protein
LPCTRWKLSSCAFIGAMSSSAPPICMLCCLPGGDRCHLRGSLPLERSFFLCHAYNLSECHASLLMRCS